MFWKLGEEKQEGRWGIYSVNKCYRTYMKEHLRALLSGFKKQTLGIF